MLPLRTCDMKTESFSDKNGHLVMQVGVPKKPYNPVLGEVFCCYWDVPGGKRTPPNETEKVSSIQTDFFGCYITASFTRTLYYSRGF